MDIPPPYLPRPIPSVFRPLSISQKGILACLHITIKSNVIVLASIALLSTSTVFGLVHGLHHLKLPDKLVHLFFFSFRYIHVIYSEYHKITNAMKARGFEPGTGLHTYKTSLIELREITSSCTVFERLNFQLRAGDRIGIVGPNGCGKTTLLHLIVGLIKPNAGDVIVSGRPRKSERDFRDVRKRVGLLFQDPEDQLFCPTVAEDVAFGPLNLRIPRERVQHIVRQTLDEPTAGLDETATQKIEEILLTKTKTYILVSHQREVLEKTTDKIYKMGNGLLQELQKG